ATPPETDSLSLHAALPISRSPCRARAPKRVCPQPVTSEDFLLRMTPRTRGEAAIAQEAILLEHRIGNGHQQRVDLLEVAHGVQIDRKSTRLNSSHVKISYA